MPSEPEEEETTPIPDDEDEADGVTPVESEGDDDKGDVSEDGSSSDG